MPDKTTRHEPLVLTCQEVAALLQVPDETVKSLHRTGQLRAVMIGTREVATARRPGICRGAQQ
jgi:excisionase family DNA binding protein